MKFRTTESAIVRYEALPDTWVEYARPHELHHGEIAVFTSGPAIPLARSIYAAIYVHAGGGCYAVELVVGGAGSTIFEEAVFARRIRDYAEIKALLLAELKRLGVDTRGEESKSPPRARRRVIGRGPEVRTTHDQSTVALRYVDLAPCPPIDEEDCLTDGPEDRE